MWKEVRVGGWIGQKLRYSVHRLEASSSEEEEEGGREGCDYWSLCQMMTWLISAA